MFGIKRLKKWWCVEHELMYDCYREVLARFDGVEEDVALMRENPRMVLLESSCTVDALIEDRDRLAKKLALATEEVLKCRDCNSRLNDAVKQNRELESLVLKLTRDFPPNPALENVLVKLRIYTERISPSYKDSDVVLNSFKAKLTLGDLRRWVESEKPAEPLTATKINSQLTTMAKNLMDAAKLESEKHLAGGPNG